MDSPIRPLSRAQARREAARGERRQAMLQRMTPVQRVNALKQEAAFKQNEAAKAKTAQDAKTRRTVGKVGTKEEREAFRTDRQALRREDMLKSMTPEQQESALKQEAAFKQNEAAKAKAAQEAKTRRTVGKVGTKEEREAFRADRQALRREDMLKSMTPEQQESALKQEAAFKQNEAAKDQAATEAKEKRTVAIVADKAAREAFGKPRGTPTRLHLPGLSNSKLMLDAEMSALNQSLTLLAA